MTGPIIDPKWFYWLQVCDSIRFLSFLLAAFLGIASVVLALAMMDMYGEDMRKTKNTLIALTVFTLVFVAAGILTPSKETMIEMEIAKHVTYESAATVIETITDTTDELLEKLAK